MMELNELSLLTLLKTNSMAGTARQHIRKFIKFFKPLDDFFLKTLLLFPKQMTLKRMFVNLFFE